MISEHSAHLTPLSVDFRTWLWRYTYLLLLISMLWHRQAIFESKGDKLSSSAESRIRTRDPRHLFASRLNARWQTDWAIEDQAKNLNSTARPYDQRAFSPLDPTVSWLSHLALAIYIFVVVNFDALAQASDFRIERRQVVFLCWEQDSNPGTPDTYSPADWMLADKPTELSRIKLKTWTRQPVPMISEHSAHLTPLSVDFRTWLWRYTYLLLLISMLWHRQAIFESKGDKLSSSAESRIRTRGPDTYSPADWMLADKPTELSRIKLKTWTRQPVPMISEHSAHLTPLSVDFRTWLWRYTYLLLLISMLWHRQAIFESKGDKLSSSAESRIRTRGPRHLFASRLNARWQTDWAIEDQAKNLNSTARPYDQRAFSPLDPTVSWLSHLALAIYIFVVVNFDALAQASDFRIERRQVVFLCWEQDSNPGPQTPIRQQTECSLTNRLSYRGSS